MGVDLEGGGAKILHEAVLAGPLTALNGRYKLRVTRISLAAGGHVGHHNHLGPGIRLMQFGRMEYVLPNWRTIYGPGDFFFESGTVDHQALNRTDQPNEHLLFEVLSADVKGASLIKPRDKEAPPDARTSAALRMAAVPGAWEAVAVVGSRGASVRVIHEAVLEGFLTELNGKYKLRISQIDLEPGGIVGPHTTLGPGTHMVTSGALAVDGTGPRRVVQSGELFFHAGDVPLTTSAEGDSMAEDLLFELLPVEVKGSSARAATPT